MKVFRAFVGISILVPPLVAYAQDADELAPRANGVGSNIVSQ